MQGPAAEECSALPGLSPAHQGSCMHLRGGALGQGDGRHASGLHSVFLLILTLFYWYLFFTDEKLGAWKDPWPKTTQLSGRTGVQNQGCLWLPPWLLPAPQLKSQDSPSHLMLGFHLTANSPGWNEAILFLALRDDC